MIVLLPAGLGEGYIGIWADFWRLYHYPDQNFKILRPYHYPDTFGLQNAIFDPDKNHQIWANSDMTFCSIIRGPRHSQMRLIERPMDSKILTQEIIVM